VVLSFQLANSEQHRAHYALLEIFTYKTYQDYLRTIFHHFVSRVALKLDDDPSEKKKKEQKVALPELSQTQITKLKHLSLLSYAMQQRVILSIHFCPYS
jgi:COP9 signalosome complex subunit 7